MRTSLRLSVAILSAVCLGACGSSASGVDAAADAALAVDARGDAVAPGIEIAPFEPVPATIVASGCGDDWRWPLGTRVAFDDCVECMCTTYGRRCQRSATCERDVCVFVDGTVVEPDASAVVATCFDCTCSAAASGSCVRRPDEPCPADGCQMPDGDVIPAGTKRFVSECHVCTCDATLGLLCDNLCHPECYCAPDGEPGACAALCTPETCDAAIPPDGLSVPDQAQLRLDGTACTCDYGDFLCAAPG